MTPEQFAETLAMGETVSIEFKRCGNQPGQDTFETICSFSNRFGGSIFLGIADDGTVTGIPTKAALSIKRNIINTVKNEVLFDPPVAVEFEDIVHDSKLVIRVWVPSSPVIHRYKKTVFDRIEDVDVKVTKPDALALLYLRKQGMYSEQKIYPYLTDSDLDLDRMGTYRRMAYRKRANHPWREMGDREILKSMRLYALNYETGVEGYTLAAALLLGRDDVIASVCPAYKTDALVVIEDTDRYDDRLTVTTNLVDAHRELSEFLAKHLPDRFQLEGSHAISPRDIIVREIVANSLMHREYLSLLPARITINRDRLTATNASRASFEGQLTPENVTPIPKNPIIERFFNQIGLAEELGSGTKALFKYTRVYSGADPMLKEGDVFTAVIPLRFPQVGNSANGQDTEGAKGSVTENSGTGSISIPAVQAPDLSAGGATPSPSPRRTPTRSTSDQRWSEIEALFIDHPAITVKDVAARCGISPRTAQRFLAQLVDAGVLEAHGNTRGRTYSRAADPGPNASPSRSTR